MASSKLDRKRSKLSTPVNRPPRNSRAGFTKNKSLSRADKGLPKRSVIRKRHSK